MLTGGGEVEGHGGRKKRRGSSASGFGGTTHQPASASTSPWTMPSRRPPTRTVRYLGSCLNHRMIPGSAFSWGHQVKGWGVNTSDGMHQVGGRRVKVRKVRTAHRCLSQFADDHRRPIDRLAANIHGIGAATRAVRCLVAHLRGNICMVVRRCPPPPPPDYTTPVTSISTFPAIACIRPVRQPL